CSQHGQAGTRAGRPGSRRGTRSPGRPTSTASSVPPAFLVGAERRVVTCAWPVHGDGVFGFRRCGYPPDAVGAGGGPFVAFDELPPRGCAGVQGRRGVDDDVDAVEVLA